MKPSQLNTDEENRLISAASKGDREAFGEIVKLYEKLVYNTVKMKIPCAEDCLDVSQEVFIKLWRAIGTYRGDCRFTTWVYRICLNACLDFLRREQHIKTEQFPTHTDKEGDEITLEFADESSGACPERSLERNEAVRAVRSAIMRLSAEQREVVRLRDIEGYSYEEISEMLDIEIGTVKSRLNRARLNLKQMLAPVYSE